jgi:uncharacterized damage-inducible protein DinB
LPFNVIASRFRKTDQRFISLAKEWSAEELDEKIIFQFVDGGDGIMTRKEILLHLVNHSTYHRGVISALLYS